MGTAEGCSPRCRRTCVQPLPRRSLQQLTSRPARCSFARSMPCGLLPTTRTSAATAAQHSIQFTRTTLLRNSRTSVVRGISRPTRSTARRMNRMAAPPHLLVNLPIRATLLPTRRQLLPRLRHPLLLRRARAWPTRTQWTVMSLEGNPAKPRSSSMGPTAATATALHLQRASLRITADRMSLHLHQPCIWHLKWRLLQQESHRKS